jgi:hypothetical protein
MAQNRMEKAMTCVCGHEHTDGCPCGCSYYQADDGNEGGPVQAFYASYRGIYRGPYTLDPTTQETA